MLPRFERFQPCEEGEHDPSHMERGLLPICSRDVEPVRKRGAIKSVAHHALSSCLVSASLSQNREDVSNKMPGDGPIRHR